MIAYTVTLKAEMTFHFFFLASKAVCQKSIPRSEQLRYFSATAFWQVGLFLAVRFPANTTVFDDFDPLIHSVQIQILPPEILSQQFNEDFSHVFTMFSSYVNKLS